MNLLYPLAVGALFGAGVYALLKRDLIRIIIGLSLLSYSVNLFLIAVGHTRGLAPIYPLPEAEPVSDPLVQALILTAIVINSGTTAVTIGFVHRAFKTYGTLDQHVVTADQPPEDAA